MDTTALGWAVQRLGAGCSTPGEVVDPHAGLRMHHKLGDQVEQGEPVCTLYAADEGRLAGPLALVRGAVEIRQEWVEPAPLIGEVVTKEVSTVG